MSTNWHPTEEDLILHFYAEGDAADATRIDDHLRACPSCRASWLELGETLKLVDQAAIPEPGPGFERVMWARVQQALPAPKPSVWSVRYVLPIAATLFVTAIAGSYAWMTWHRGPAGVPAPDQPQTVATATKPDPKLGERVLLTALEDHLQQAQMLLVELKNAPEEASDFDFERAMADELISSGRFYRASAQLHGQAQFAQMLDDLESVLLDIARSEKTVGKSDLKSVRARIDSQDLLFKVRATSKQVHERQKDLRSAANE